MIPTDAEIIFWFVAFVVTALLVAAFLIIGKKIWDD